jgi:sugar phosphate isomerase/epimerase
MGSHFKLFAAIAAFISLTTGIHAAEYDLFARTNLVAWCIVPFDAKKRGPEERAQMLEDLGIRRLAYDYRSEHIPSFDAEIAALKKHNIELTAWWFPSILNGEARTIVNTLKRNKVQTQLWVTGSGETVTTPRDNTARVEQEVLRLGPIADAAQKIGCKVALYNHGGWFGEPTNQLAIIQRLRMPNVGIVYNLHHAHDQMDRFKDLLALMKPHLFAINLNGMVEGGDKSDKKILPLGQGKRDLELLKIIKESGWRGPIGILNHTDADAELRLRDNLEGLDWLVTQLNGSDAGPKPTPRSWKP